MAYDSSSDEETSSLLRSKREAIVTPLHSDKNIAEPVTSQGVFGPNGMNQTSFTDYSITSPQ
jgi:hypothetical protein